MEKCSKNSSNNQEFKDETHSLNMFYYKGFGSNGTELDTLGYYFDNSVEEAGELRSGAHILNIFICYMMEMELMLLNLVVGQK